MCAATESCWEEIRIHTKLGRYVNINGIKENQVQWWERLIPKLGIALDCGSPSWLRRTPLGSFIKNRGFWAPPLGSLGSGVRVCILKALQANLKPLNHVICA